MILENVCLVQREATALRRAFMRLAMLAICVLAVPSESAAAEYSLALRPDWVVAVEAGIPTKAQLSQSTDGVAYTLVDEQVFATTDARTRYRRFVSRAINSKGVESIANIEIGFDPSFQQLVLHSINVLRNGRVIAKLPTAKIQVIQQEKELAARIYDGRKTASIFLDDVRVGDSVDYEYSTVGRNPVFDGFEFGSIDLQYGVPVARIHARLILPAGQFIKLSANNVSTKATIAESDGLRTHRWDLRDVPALTVEEGAPSWYRPYAEVEWSQFADWQAISRWAQPLYRTAGKLGSALDTEVGRIAKAETTPAGRMLAALRFVQSEVRYLGVETGRNSHAPNPPRIVFERRFGDCKDKVLLTLSLLDRLGIEAHAALVNTDVRRGIADRLPNPAAFDHVIVQARVDGNDYWIDPTRATQESDLANLYQPDFDLSLVVAPETKSLTSMKNPASVRSKRSIHVVLDARQGFTKPVRYDVKTVYEGGAAEFQRDSLSETNREELQKNYLQFYANSYPRISVAAPIVIDDDKLMNRVTIQERYFIANIASKPDANGKRDVYIETPDMDELLGDPKATIRVAPLQLRFPVEVSQKTEVLLPEVWPIEESNSEVANPAFSFSRTVKSDADRLRFTIEDHYQSLADEVSAREVPRYTESLARARDAMGYNLSWHEPGVAKPLVGIDRMNWPVALVALLALGLFVWIARAGYRFDPVVNVNPVPELIGIGGWLILLGFSLLGSLVRIGMNLQVMVDALAADNWALVTSYGSASYHALWAPLLLFELVCNLGMLVFATLIIVMFLQRRSAFPRLAIAFYVVGFVFQSADSLVSTALPDVTFEAKEFVRLASAAIGTALWSAYLTVSRRVRSTFVRRLGCTEIGAAERAPQSPRASSEAPAQLSASMMSDRGSAIG